jgi:hypothetical protein
MRERGGGARVVVQQASARHARTAVVAHAWSYGGIEEMGRIAAAAMWGALTTAWVVKAPRIDVGRVELAWRD